MMAEERALAPPGLQGKFTIKPLTVLVRSTKLVPSGPKGCPCHEHGCPERSVSC
jgi:hypothetical protein